MTPSDDYEPRENDELVEPFLAGLPKGEAAETSGEREGEGGRPGILSRIRRWLDGLRKEGSSGL